MEKYTVLSPWAERKVNKAQPLSPRISDLEHARIGIIGLFKEYHPPLVECVRRAMQERFPEARVNTYIYTIDQKDPEDDPYNWPEFKAFIDQNDCFVEIGADGGSCSLFAGYVACTFEKYGKPVALYVTEDFVSAATCGSGAKGFAHLRKVVQPLGMAHVPPGQDPAVLVNKTYAPVFVGKLDEVIAALTEPLTEEELHPAESDEGIENATFTGTLAELSDLFYQHGWTNGSPIVPPTREAVDEMLRGTDLPPDYVIGYLPPMQGKMTVEKIAINAVMAGCQPTHLPILLAIAQILVDPSTLKPFTTCANGYPKLNLECMTTSTLGFAPLFVLNGPIRHDVGMHIDGNYLTAYDRAKSTIPLAYAYMIMNISGVRGYKEDSSNTGHETRLGMIVAENEEASVWQPLCCQFKTPEGEERFQAGDNAVTMYFFCNRDSFKCQDTASALDAAINERVYGQDSGMAIAFPPNITEKLAADNMTPERVMDYIVKYARRPFEQFPRGMKGNNHEPKNTVLPFGGNYPVEKYISTDHFMVFTGGNMGTNMPKAVTWLTDGGHGTPSCAKIQLPEEWDKLVEDYRPSTTVSPVKYY